MVAPYPTNLSWMHIENLVNILAYKLKGQKFDMVVGVARGGLIPAAMLASRLEIRRVRSFQLASYSEEGNQQPVRTLDSSLSIIQEIERLEYANVLYVEDIVDTGVSMSLVRSIFTLPKGYKSEATFASLVLKAHKAPRCDWPDVCGHMYTEPGWVKFPWETFFEPASKELSF